MLRIAAILAVASLSLSTAYAAPCKDAKGKFIKCPPAVVTTTTTTAAKTSKATKTVTSGKPVRCRNAKGHFAKCGTPGAKPA